MASKCWMDDPEWKQCCCTCRFHLADHYHCLHVTPMEKLNLVDMPRAKHKSIFGEKMSDACDCSIQRGWICAPPDFYPKAYSNWPEHSVGCELWEEVKHE